MFSLGQAVRYSDTLYSPTLPAILIGNNTHGAPIIAHINEHGEFVKTKQVFAMDIRIVREKNKKSPSGKALYYGKFCKHGLLANITIKTPPEEELVAELKKIAKLIKEEEKIG